MLFLNFLPFSLRINALAHSICTFLCLPYPNVKFKRKNTRSRRWYDKKSFLTSTENIHELHCTPFYKPFLGGNPVLHCQPRYEGLVGKNCFRPYQFLPFIETYMYLIYFYFELQFVLHYQPYHFRPISCIHLVSYFTPGWNPCDFSIFRWNPVHWVALASFNWWK